MTEQLAFDLDAVPLKLLVEAVARRVGLRLVTMTSSPASDDIASSPTSSPAADDTSAIERRRARWRRSQAARRARLRAMTGDDAMTRAPVVVVNTKNNNNNTDDTSSLPGLDVIGPSPEPSPAEPDDLRRRRLRLGVAELLARAELDRQRAAGRHVDNEGGWLRTVAASQAEQRADEISAAIEAALARWDTATTATHVASLLERPATTTPTRTSRQHVDVELPERLPLVEARAGFAALKAALQRTA